MACSSGKGIARLVIFYVNHIRVNNTPQRAKKIGGQHTARSVTSSQPVSRRTVGHAARTGCIIKGKFLSEQCANDAREHIAHAAARHACITGINDAHRIIAGDNGPRPFQNDNTSVTFYQTLG